jgi:2-deoxy-D-gluconate 3-dehydrogenase
MILDRFKLDGKTAVVTGSATGLGKAISVGLAEAGADIAGIYHKASPRDTQTSIEALGRKFIGIKADLLDGGSIAEIFSHAVGSFGKIDILVNTAGLIRREKSLDFTEKDWDDVMQVNLKAAFFLCQASARQFIRQQSRGKIINIASLLSFQGGILVPSYTASKHGIIGITRALANEFAAKKINVNAIAPGYMETDLTKALREDPERNPGIVKRIPAGAWGSPEDLQGAAVYLASEASDYVNGSVLTVDGGWMAR